MNILGMGPMEVILIIVLALIVFGPAKLPEIMGQVGKAIGDFRRATSDLSEEFNKTIQAELQETKAAVEEAKAVMGEAKTAVTDVQTSVNSAMTGVPAPTRIAEPGDALAATNGLSSEPHAAINGFTSGDAQPPLAETAPWSWETPAVPPTDAPSSTDLPSASEPSTPSPESATAGPTAESTAPGPLGEATANPAATDPPARGRIAHDDLAPPY